MVRPKLVIITPNTRNKRFRYGRRIEGKLGSTWMDRCRDNTLIVVPSGEFTSHYDIGMHPGSTTKDSTHKLALVVEIEKVRLPRSGPSLIVSHFIPSTRVCP